MALILVQIMFGSWPIVGKLALQSIPSTTLVSFRVAGAALVFIALQRLSRRDAPVQRKLWPLLILCSLLGVVFNQLLFVKGLSMTTAINATLLSTTIPLSTLVISVLLGRDRGTLRLAIGILIAAAGVVFLVDPTRAEFSDATRTGDLLIIANSLCYGAYIALSKDLVKHYHPITIITWIFVVAAIVTIPMGAPGLRTIVASPPKAVVWLEILYIILVPTVGAYYLNAWALARVSSNTVAVYVYLQPLIAFVLAPILLGENLSWRVLIAAVLVFAGVALVTRGNRSRALKEVSEHPEALGH